jgi:two-component system, response regulator PdtaR
VKTAAKFQPKPVCRRRRRVLIRIDIVEILTDNGFDVVGEAADGEKAVRWLRNTVPTWW